jgi:8-oxo-dGTP pyrophosphatase MutT (NUDIX family)
VSLVDNPEWDELSHDTRVFARSRVVQEVLESLRDQDLVPALGGWRNEPFAVRQDFHSPPELIMERAAGVLFGAPAYGVFLNGYTCQDDDDDDDENHIDIDSGKPTHVWIGRRAKNKATWPGRLDSLAAGGLAAGMLPRQAMMQECQEEAGICKEALLDKIQAVSAVSYTGYNEDMWGLKRDVLFCFDLQLPPDFEPVPVDGEVDSFEKMSIATIMDLLQKPVCEDDDSDNEWKPNVGVVLIDFLLRHGAIDADDIAFLPLVESLRGAKCA